MRSTSGAPFRHTGETVDLTGGDVVTPLTRPRSCLSSAAIASILEVAGIEHADGASVVCVLEALIAANAGLTTNAYTSPARGLMANTGVVVPPALSTAETDAMAPELDGSAEASCAAPTKVRHAGYPVHDGATAGAMPTGQAMQATRDAHIPIDGAAVAAAMSKGKAKKAARAVGICNPLGHDIATTFLRAWSLLPPTPVLETAIIAPFLAMQRTYHTTRDALLLRSIFGRHHNLGSPRPMR